MAVILLLAKIPLYGQGYYILVGDIGQTGGWTMKRRRGAAEVSKIYLSVIAK
jgi:hypothetical protein